MQEEYKVSLKAARINVNLTGKQAAQKLGVSYDTLRKWEKHPEKIKMGWIKALSEVYQVPEKCISFTRT